MNELRVEPDSRERNEHTFSHNIPGSMSNRRSTRYTVVPRSLETPARKAEESITNKHENMSKVANLASMSSGLFSGTKLDTSAMCTPTSKFPFGNLLADKASSMSYIPTLHSDVIGRLLWTGTHLTARRINTANQVSGSQIPAIALCDVGCPRQSRRQRGQTRKSRRRKLAHMHRSSHFNQQCFNLRSPGSPSLT